MMTTMAALLAAVPLALAPGMARNSVSLSISIVGRLIVSQMLTCTRRPSCIFIRPVQSVDAAPARRPAIDAERRG